MTHFDLAEARTMARAHRAAAPYDRLAIKLMQACEEIERLRQALKDAQRERETDDRLRDLLRRCKPWLLAAGPELHFAINQALEARDD